MNPHEIRTKKVFFEDRCKRRKEVAPNNLKRAAGEDAGISKKDHKRFFSFVEKTSDCWIWVGVRVRDGYGNFTLKGRSHGAHRVSWIIHHGPIPKDGNGKTLHVLHDCPTGDNPACVNPDHLWLGTQLENMQDRGEKGRTARTTGDRNGSRTCPASRPRGERNTKAKLSSKQVTKIRSEYKKFGKRGLKTRLARKFNVSQVLVGKIVRGEIWKHLLKC